MSMGLKLRQKFRKTLGGKCRSLVGTFYHHQISNAGGAELLNFTSSELLEVHSATTNTTVEWLLGTVVKKFYPSVAEKPLVELKHLCAQTCRRVAGTAASAHFYHKPATKEGNCLYQEPTDAVIFIGFELTIIATKNGALTHSIAFRNTIQIARPLHCSFYQLIEIRFSHLHPQH